MPSRMKLAISVLIVALLALASVKPTNGVPVMAQAGEGRRLLSAVASSSANTTYGLLFDAGSSGTRLNVYSWPARVFQTLPPTLSVPLQLTYLTDRTAPGINVPAGIVALERLLNLSHAYFASIGVPTSQLSSFPVFLTATAGMRILSDSERTSIMESVRDVLGASPFMFMRSWARVIPGEEEGVYGFVAANYVRGTLLAPLNATGTNTSDPTWFTNTLATVSNATYGAIDLGGASSQITFAPPAGVDLLSNAYRLSLTSTAAATVYTHSFLYFGVNEGVFRMNELVLAEYVAANPGATLTYATPIPNPCYLTGTPLGFTNFTSTSVAPGLTVSFVGTGDPAGCMRVAAALMLRSSYCLTDPKPQPLPINAAGPVSPPASLPPLINPLPGVNGSTCSINGVYQPPLSPPALATTGAPPAGARNVSFLAFSFYTYMYPFFGVAPDAPLSQLLDEVATFCALDFATANASYYSRTVVPAAIPAYCLYGSFGAALLTVGYKIPTDGQYVTVMTEQFSYAAGAMLVAVNQLAWDFYVASGGVVPAANGDGSTVPSAFKFTTIVIGVILAVSVVAVVTGLICSRVRARSGSGLSGRSPRDSPRAFHDLRGEDSGSSSGSGAVVDWRNSVAPVHGASGSVAVAFAGPSPSFGSANSLGMLSRERSAAGRAVVVDQPAGIALSKTPPSSNRPSASSLNDT